MDACLNDIIFLSSIAQLFIVVENIHLENTHSHLLYIFRPLTYCKTQERMLLRASVNFMGSFAAFTLGKRWMTTNIRFSRAYTQRRA